MIGCFKSFSSYSPYVGNQKIKIAYGSLSTIVGKGSIATSKSLVLHVPNISCNLLFVSKLTRDLKCSSSLLTVNFRKWTWAGRLAMLKKVMDSTALKMEVTCVDKLIRLK